MKLLDRLLGRAKQTGFESNSALVITKRLTKAREVFAAAEKGAQTQRYRSMSTYIKSVQKNAEVLYERTLKVKWSQISDLAEEIGELLTKTPNRRKISRKLAQIQALL